MFKKYTLVVIFFLINSNIYSCFSQDGNKLLLTNRDRCEDALSTTQYTPYSCVILLAISQNSPEAKYLNTLSCLNYYVEKEKCKKESDVPPPDLKP